jgi:hypothetical protein
VVEDAAMLRAVAVACLAAFAAALAVPAEATAEPAGAQAPTADAARHFDLGLRTFARGDFARSADEFELAYRLVPHGDALWNAARARDRAGQAARAATLYAKYLREVGDQPTERGEANARLLALSAKLGQIAVQGEATGWSVDGQPIEEKAFYVIPGAHILRATSPGGAARQRTVQVAAGDAVSVALDPLPEESAKPAPPATTSRSAEASPPGAAGGRGSWAPRPLMLVVAAGATGVAAALTVASGVDTLAALRTYDASPTTANLADGHARQTRTNVGIGVSAGLAAITGAATIWWAVGRAGAPAPVTVSLAPSSLAVTWRY